MRTVRDIAFATLVIVGIAVIGAGLGALTGCAELGLVAPQSFEEKLTAGLASVTASRDTTTSLLEAKKISSDDAQHVAAELVSHRSIAPEEMIALPGRDQLEGRMLDTMTVDDL